MDSQHEEDCAITDERVLELLHDQEPLGPVHVAETLGCSLFITNSALRRLAGRGLVEKRKGKRFGIIGWVRLSPRVPGNFIDVYDHSLMLMKGGKPSPC